MSRAALFAVATTVLACQEMTGEHVMQPAQVAAQLAPSSIGIGCNALGGGAPTERDESFSKGTVSVHYPVFTFDCENASRVVNETLRQYVTKRATPTGRPFELAMSCQTVSLSSTHVSVVCTEVSYTGGAHPFHDSATFNFEVAGASARALSLGDLVRPDAEPALDAICEAELGTQGVETERGRVRAKDFLLYSDGLVLHFPEYSVSSYLAGTRDVFIPLAELRPLLRHGNLYERMATEGGGARGHAI